MKENIGRNCIEICRIPMLYGRTSKKRKMIRNKLREILSTYNPLEETKRK